MKKNQKILLVSVALIGLGVYFFYKQGKKDSVSAQKEEEKNEPAKADWDKVLKRGSTGIEVGILQRALRQLKVDENFGILTETRLKRVMGVTETSLNNYNKFMRSKK